jgi:hypothetical protein
MKRFLIGLLLLLPLLPATFATAQSGDWARLRSTKRGTLLVIETNVNAYGPADFNRCKLLRVDDSTLTCTALDGKTRFTFAEQNLDAVYKVKHGWIKPLLGTAAVGLMLGGLASANGPAFAVGALGGIIWLFANMVQNTNHQIDVWTGAAPEPLPRNENRELLYLRP